MIKWLNLLIYSFIVTKNLDNKVFDYLEQCDETLTSIAWVIRDFYHRTLKATLGQAVFGIDIAF